MFKKGVEQHICDMELAEELAEKMGTDCGNCAEANRPSENIKLTGWIESDGQGVYVEYICLTCGDKGTSGDGDFLDYYVFKDGDYEYVG